MGTGRGPRATILTVPPPSPRLSARRAILVTCLVLTVALAALISVCGGSDKGPDDSTLSAAGRQGKQVASDNGCGACHSTSGSKGTGPTWKGLAGSKVQLADGSSVTADDDYLRRSITEPKAQIVDGFPSGVMPSYNLSAQEIDDVIAYLHDLAKPTD